MNITLLQVGEVEAERFCKAFEKLHKKLVCVPHSHIIFQRRLLLLTSLSITCLGLLQVYEELDPETAKRYLLNS